jgi:hypothetical protein
MFSDRVPPLDEPNAYTLALNAARLAGAPLLDLASFDPTRAGLSPLGEARAILAAQSLPAHAPEPLGDPAARAAVAEALREAAPALTADQVILTASTSDSDAQLFRLLCDPGDAVLLPSPSYPLFEPIARAEGVRVIPYRVAFDGAWHLDRAAFAQAAAQPGVRAIVTVEPNLPTGSVLDAGDRACLRDTAAQYGLAIIADEVFRAHAWPGHAPLASWLAEADVLTFVLGGLSKHCGLPQLKLGWIAVTGPAALTRQALARLEWLCDLSLSVNAPVQHAAAPLLALHEPFVMRVGQRVAGNLATLDRACAAQPALQRLPGVGGWAAVVRVPALESDEALAIRAIERGLIVHPGQFYDLAPGAHLVLSLITDPLTFARGAGELQAMFTGA